MKSKLATPNGRADRLSKVDQPIEAKIAELYLAAFSREPRPAELKTAIEYLTEPRTDAAGNPIEGAKPSPEGFQDLIWALMNTKEFLFNH
jgi:hypothetical protein